MSTMVDLLQLIKGDIPDGRNHLQDSCGNLEKVASYCEGNYAQVSVIVRSHFNVIIYDFQIKIISERGAQFPG